MFVVNGTFRTIPTVESYGAGVFRFHGILVFVMRNSILVGHILNSSSIQEDPAKSRREGRKRRDGSLYSSSVGAWFVTI